MGRLGGAPERELPGCRLERGNTAATFERGGDGPARAVGALEHPSRGFEGTRGVAEHAVIAVDDIVWYRGEQWHMPFRLGGVYGHDRGQLLVVHVDQLERVLSHVAVLGNDQGDCLPNETDPIAREHGLRRLYEAGHLIDMRKTRLGKIRGGDDGHHTGSPGGARRV